MSPSKVGELIPACQYDSGKDIVGGPKPQALRYLEAISTGATRLQSWTEKLFKSDRDRTATEKLFLLSGLHLTELFTEILSAIQEPWEEITTSLELVGNIRRDLRRLLKMAGESEGESGGQTGGEIGKASCKSWSTNNKMVPNLTCYELTVRILIERVEIIREDKPPKDRIGNFPSDSIRGYSICLTCLTDSPIS